jgi:hypothetical protein
MKRLTLLVCGLALVGFSVGCDVDVAEDGRLPTVSVDPGNVPDVDVEGPEVRTEKRTVEVPVIEPAKEGEANAEEDGVQR